MQDLIDLKELSKDSYAALRAALRAHHEAQPAGSRLTRCFCVCGSPSGGPAGTEACREYERLYTQLLALAGECEQLRGELANETAERVR